MRILHVINSLAAGGAEKLVSELTTSIADEYDVTLYTFQSKHDIFQENINENVTFHKGTKGFFSIKELRVLFKLIKNHDIIHVHLFPAFYIVALLSVFCRKRIYIYTEHNSYNKRRTKLYWFLEKWVYSKYNTVICISQGVENALKQWIGNTVKTSVITNFVRLDKIRSIDMEVISGLDLHRKIPLVMVGSFSEQKDHETLIKSMAILPENYVLLLIGDGPKISYVKNIAEELDVSHRVFFLGVKKNVVSILKGCKYGVLSSNWEGFGIVALEYMSSGLVTLGTNVSGLNEVIPIEENLFEVGNELQLANRIQEIERNAPLREVILKKQNLLLPNYDIAASVESHLHLYKENLKNSSV